MNPIIFHEIPFKLSADELAPQLRLAPGSEDFEEFFSLVGEAAVVGRPKALYTVSYITGRGDDFVELDGVRMESRLMAANFSSVHRVFPYVMTCGEEAEAWSRSIRDPLQAWWADEIMARLLGKATEHLHAHLRNLGLGKFSSMNPGSLPDWPITEQAKLFPLLGDVKAAIGVTLTESMLMIPAKSVSGIFFQTESGFESCELCGRERCPGRRKPFDRDQYDRLVLKGTTSNQ